MLSRILLIAATAAAISTTVAADIITVPTAAGIDIRVSSDFAGPAQAVIADAVAAGIKFKSIRCYNHARTHVSRSNHFKGDACDTSPAIPKRIVLAHGLRSGCHWGGCAHFDNAKNVGGMAKWNNDTKGKRTVSAKKRRVAGGHTTDLSPKRKGRCDGQALVPCINAQLARWVRPTGKCPAGYKEQLATQYGNGDGYLGKKAYCGQRVDSTTPTYAVRNPVCGATKHFVNPDTGQSVTATNTDKGPFTHAKLDMSPAAARALGMTGRQSSRYLCVS